MDDPAVPPQGGRPVEHPLVLVASGRREPRDPVARLSLVDDDDELLDGMRAAARHASAAGITTVRDLGDRGYLGGEANGAAGLRHAVREHVDTGVDVVEVMASGGRLTPGTRSREPRYSVDELRVVVDEAPPWPAGYRETGGVPRRLESLSF